MSDEMLKLTMFGGVLAIVVMNWWSMWQVRKAMRGLLAVLGAAAARGTVYSKEEWVIIRMALNWVVDE